MLHSTTGRWDAAPSLRRGGGCDILVAVAAEEPDDAAAAASLSASASFLTTLSTVMPPLPPPFPFPPPEDCFMKKILLMALFFLASSSWSLLGEELSSFFTGDFCFLQLPKWGVDGASFSSSLEDGEGDDKTGLDLGCDVPRRLEPFSAFVLTLLEDVLDSRACCWAFFFEGLRFGRVAGGSSSSLESYRKKEN